jgi:hypothetical protein
VISLAVAGRFWLKKFNGPQLALVSGFGARGISRRSAGSGIDGVLSVESAREAEVPLSPARLSRPGAVSLRRPIPGRYRQGPKSRSGIPTSNSLVHFLSADAPPGCVFVGSQSPILGLTTNRPRGDTAAVELYGHADRLSAFQLGSLYPSAASRVAYPKTSKGTKQPCDSPRSSPEYWLPR